MTPENDVGLILKFDFFMWTDNCTSEWVDSAYIVSRQVCILSLQQMIDL